MVEPPNLSATITLILDNLFSAHALFGASPPTPCCVRSPVAVVNYDDLTKICADKNRLFAFLREQNVLLVGFDESGDLFD